MLTKSIKVCGMMLLPLMASEATSSQNNEYFDTGVQEEVQRYLNPRTAIDIKRRADKLAQHIDEHASDLASIKRAVLQELPAIESEFPDQVELIRKRLEVFFESMDEVAAARVRREEFMRWKVAGALVAGVGVIGLVVGIIRQKEDQKEETWREKGRRATRFALIGGGCAAVLASLAVVLMNDTSPVNFTDGLRQDPSWPVSDDKPSDD